MPPQIHIQFISPTPSDAGSENSADLDNHSRGSTPDSGSDGIPEIDEGTVKEFAKSQLLHHMEEADQKRFNDNPNSEFYYTVEYQVEEVPLDDSHISRSIFFKTFEFKGRVLKDKVAVSGKDENHLEIHNSKNELKEYTRSYILQTADLDGMEDFGPDKIAEIIHAEVASIRFIEDFVKDTIGNTTLPTPTVLSCDPTCKNDLGRPYIFLSNEGRSLPVRDPNQREYLDPDPTKVLPRLVSEIARCQIELSQLDKRTLPTLYDEKSGQPIQPETAFKGVFCIRLDEGTDSGSGVPKFPKFLRTGIPVSDEVEAAEALATMNGTPINRGPFSTTEEWFNARLEVIERRAGSVEPLGRPGEPGYDSVGEAAEARAIREKLGNLFSSSDSDGNKLMPKLCSLIFSTYRNETSRKEAAILQHQYLDFSSIRIRPVDARYTTNSLEDDPFSLQLIKNWRYSSFVPFWRVALYPPFLLSRDPDEMQIYMSEDEVESLVEQYSKELWGPEGMPSNFGKKLEYKIKIDFDYALSLLDTLTKTRKWYDRGFREQDQPDPKTIVQVVEEICERIRVWLVGAIEILKTRTQEGNTEGKLQDPKGYQPLWKWNSIPADISCHLSDEKVWQLKAFLEQFEKAPKGISMAAKRRAEMPILSTVATVKRRRFLKFKQQIETMSSTQGQNGAPSGSEPRMFHAMPDLN